MSLELVRIRLEDGTEITNSRVFAESHGLKVLEDRPATEGGRVIAAKFKTSVAEAAESKKQPTTPKGSNTPASTQEETK